MEISNFTQAPLKMRAQIRFENFSPEDVFKVLGDPEKIPDWYLLAKQVHMHPAKEDEEASFNVEFTFFGNVYEEILHWDPPFNYIYKAVGDDFPVKDYVAEIDVKKDSDNSGVLTWDIYFEHLEGEHFKKILPVMLPAINEASMHKLSTLIGGVEVKTENYF